MREIKYRAWLKEEKRMVNVETLSLDYQQISYKPFKEEDLEFQEHLKSVMPGKFQGCLSSSLFKEIELMQYIGFKDTKGKEMYEGDIVVINTELFDDLIGIIKFGTKEYKDGSNRSYNYGFYIDIQNPPYSSMSGSLIWYLRNKVEVIGNIYENEDLIRR